MCVFSHLFCHYFLHYQHTLCQSPRCLETPSIFKLLIQGLVAAETPRLPTHQTLLAAPPKGIPRRSQASPMSSVSSRWDMPGTPPGTSYLSMGDVDFWLLLRPFGSEMTYFPHEVHVTASVLVPEQRRWCSLVHISPTNTAV